MRKVYSKTAYGLTGGKATESVFSKNHYASATPISRDVQSYIDQFSLRRVAGNAYICEASRDYWIVKDGKIKKLVGEEVDDGDKIAAAPNDHPAQFLAGILDDLEF